MGINLSWSQEPQGLDDSALRFLLTISHGSSSDIMSLNESTYHFTAPEGAPPCEVYNFSVTATYVGATYTGAGCSVFIDRPSKFHMITIYRAYHCHGKPI